MIEPTYTGAVGVYVHLGEAYDRLGLRGERSALLEAQHAYQVCYPLAYEALGHLPPLLDAGKQEAISEGVLVRLHRRAAQLLRALDLPKRQTTGRRIEAFLGAVSCQGLVSGYDGLLSCCESCYEIVDFAGLAGLFLAELAAACQRAGQCVYVFLSPWDGVQVAHVYLPELGIALVSTDGKTLLSRIPVRRLHMQSLCRTGERRLYRLAQRQVAGERETYTREALSYLAEAKRRHDALEALYLPHTDFSKVDALREGIWREVECLRP